MGFFASGICGSMDWPILWTQGRGEEAFLFKRPSIFADWTGLANEFYLSKAGNKIIIIPIQINPHSIIVTFAL